MEISVNIRQDLSTVGNVFLKENFSSTKRKIAKIFYYTAKSQSSRSNSVNKWTADFYTFMGNLKFAFKTAQNINIEM